MIHLGKQSKHMHANMSPVYRAQLELDALLLSCVDKELLTVSGRGFVVFTQWVVSLNFFISLTYLWYIDILKYYFPGWGNRRIFKNKIVDGSIP